MDQPENNIYKYIIENNTGKIYLIKNYDPLKYETVLLNDLLQTPVGFYNPTLTRYYFHKDKNQTDYNIVTRLDFNIYITRHAISCNNILDINFEDKKKEAKEEEAKEEKRPDKLPKLERLKNSQYKDMDPLIIKENAIKIKKLKDKLENEHFESNVFNKIEGSSLVFVSPLIRTWLTAILLYYTYNFTKNIHLVISPFLKEFFTDMGVKTFKKGNYPDPFSDQIDNLINFIKKYNKFTYF
jgi:hypothetical protein